MYGPAAVPALMGRRLLVAAGVRLISQLGVGYPGSPLSTEGAPGLRGGPRAGRRPPDATVTCGGRQARLHDLLARPGVHVLLHRDAGPVERVAFGRHVAVHRLTSTPGPGLVAVRPDGYSGFRCGTADVPQQRTWLERIGA